MKRTSYELYRFEDASYVNGESLGGPLRSGRPLRTKRATGCARESTNAIFLVRYAGPKHRPKQIHHKKKSLLDVLF